MGEADGERVEVALEERRERGLERLFRQAEELRARPRQPNGPSTRALSAGGESAPCHPRSGPTPPPTPRPHSSPRRRPPRPRKCLNTPQTCSPGQRWSPLRRARRLLLPLCSRSRSCPARAKRGRAPGWWLSWKRGRRTVEGRRLRGRELGGAAVRCSRRTETMRPKPSVAGRWTTWDLCTRDSQCRGARVHQERESSAPSYAQHPSLPSAPYT